MKMRVPGSIRASGKQMRFGGNLRAPGVCGDLLDRNRVDLGTDQDGRAGLGSFEDRRHPVPALELTALPDSRVVPSATSLMSDIGAQSNDRSWQPSAGQMKWEAATVAGLRRRPAWRRRPNGRSWRDLVRCEAGSRTALASLDWGWVPARRTNWESCMRFRVASPHSADTPHHASGQRAAGRPEGRPASGRRGARGPDARSG